MRNNKYGATITYALIQGLYWSIYCLMVSFASAFLLDKGFTNAQIGVILGLSYLCSALLQPTIGSLFSRGAIRLSHGIACVYALVAVLAACVRFLPLGGWAIAAIMVALFSMQSMMQPSINALHQNFEFDGRQVNFSLTRGIGSAAYAATSFIVGRLLLRFAPSLLPLLYLAASGALIAVLLLAHTADAQPRSAVDSRGSSYRDMLREHRHLILFLAGVACMFIAYSFIDAFLLQIITAKGGGSAQLGTAITLSAMTELPAMVLFGRLDRNGRGLRLFLGSIWFWLLKDVLTLLAPTPQALYAVQLLNFASVSIYVPGMMDYMRSALPQWQLLRGVTLAGTATTLGSLIATLAGGWLIDALGVSRALLAIQLFPITGAVLLTLALTRAQKEAAQARA